MADKKTLTFALMDAPYENPRSTTALRLIDIAVRRGYDVGKIDGIIGRKTRAAVKDVQLKMGMPADSYPTSQLVARLRRGG